MSRLAAVYNMVASLKEAKDKIVINLASNIATIVTTTVINLLLTPYLIRKLSVEIYGTISLSISIVGYFVIFTGSISNTVGRFVALHLNKNEITRSNTYFNSALVALIGLCGCLLPVVVIVTAFFTRLFQVPIGYETASSLLFFQVAIASFITAISSPFFVSTLVTHRFDLRNIVNILSQISRFLVILVCFTYLSASLVYVGLSYITMALLTFLCSILIAKWLTPQLVFKFKMFRWKSAYEMSQMSIWVLIHQLGVFLYMHVSIIVINIFLGPTQCGRYAPIKQLVTLLALFGVALTTLFTPVAYDHIAKNNIKILVKQLSRVIKFLGLIVALPVGLLCGLSVPILQRWLGTSFVDLWPLVLLLSIPWQIGISVRPTFAVFEGFNKIKLPAVTLIIGGVLNILISIAMIKFTNLGILGVGLSLCICSSVRNLFFVALYAAIITGQPKRKYIEKTILGLSMALLVGLAAFGLSRIFYLSTIPNLLAAMIFLSVIYALFCYTLVLDKEERVFLLSLIPKKNE